MAKVAQQHLKTISTDDASWSYSRHPPHCWRRSAWHRPDGLRPTGSTRGWNLAEQQDARLRDCIERHLLSTRAAASGIVMIEPMIRFVADLFFERVQAGHLVETSRGRWVTGGSNPYLADDGLPAGRASWTCRFSEQAKRVYEYTTQFWYCVAGLAEAMLAKEPAAV